MTYSIIQDNKGYKYFVSVFFHLGKWVINESISIYMIA
jgi:hypothetical protein